MDEETVCHSIISQLAKGLGEYFIFQVWLVFERLVRISALNVRSVRFSWPGLIEDFWLCWVQKCAPFLVLIKWYYFNCIVFVSKDVSRKTLMRLEMHILVVGEVVFIFSYPAPRQFGHRNATIFKHWFRTVWSFKKHSHHLYYLTSFSMHILYKPIFLWPSRNQSHCRSAMNEN